MENGDKAWKMLMDRLGSIETKLVAVEGLPNWMKSVEARLKVVKDLPERTRIHGKALWLIATTVVAVLVRLLF